MHRIFNTEDVGASPTHGFSLGGDTMRCKKCPLLPKDAEEPCYIAEGSCGIEYDNGEVGCRHSWNWCKKRAEEYRKALRHEPIV